MDPLQEYLSRFGVLEVKTGSQKIDSSHLALTLLCPSWVRWACDRAGVRFNNSVQLRQLFMHHMSQEPSNNLARQEGHFAGEGRQKWGLREVVTCLIKQIGS